MGTTTLDPATLGKEHNYTSTYVGSDSLGELLAAHPDISYQVTLPSPFLEIIATLLPISTSARPRRRRPPRSAPM